MATTTRTDGAEVRRVRDAREVPGAEHARDRERQQLARLGGEPLPLAPTPMTDMVRIVRLFRSCWLESG
jgi:hypothetical protein